MGFGAKMYKIGDDLLTVKQIANRAGVAVCTIRKRLSQGKRGDALFASPMGNGERQSLANASRMKGKIKEELPND